MVSPPPPTGHSPTDIPVLFRQSKKRKLYRQRETSPPAAPPPSADHAPAIVQTLDELVASGAADAEAEPEADEGVGASLAEILRLRKQQRKTTKSGVEFRAEGYGKGDGGLAELREEGIGGQTATKRPLAHLPYPDSCLAAEISLPRWFRCRSSTRCAEYCPPVWSIPSHTGSSAASQDLQDSGLYKSMRPK